jgi:flagellar hook-associated protein 3 FlgL
MTINKVSFLGSSQAQIARLRDLNTTLNDLTRQIASRKKHATLAGFGADAATIQRNRMDKNRVQSYLDNLTSVTNRIKQMDLAMTSARKAVGQVIEGIATAVHDSASDVSTLSTIARNALAFVQNLANLQHDGRYLFAGSDTASRPFQDASTLNNNFQAEIADWLDGTNSTAQLIANVNAFTTADLGLNPGLSASGPVAVRIDDETELDYTVRADQDGFQDIIQALALMANLPVPGPADIPTTADLENVVQQVLTMARAGVEKLDNAATRLGSNFNLIKAVQETHQQDVALLDGFISDAEDADTTEVVARLQSLQTQLQASYEVTRIASQLSLVNFL